MTKEQGIDSSSSDSGTVGCEGDDLDSSSEATSSHDSSDDSSNDSDATLDGSEKEESDSTDDSSEGSSTDSSIGPKESAPAAERKAGRKPCIIGLGLYALHSSMNHSCVPNALASYCRSESFSRAKVVVRAKEALMADSEICIDYAAGMDFESAAAKHAHLKEQYGFDCSCGATPLPLVS